MGEQGERNHLSIGEVLSLLKEEFPDVTISKIRFLESQGLLDPERTPSGYRKFYDPDVERLRWILRQQKENFLPLKVIRGRLGVDETAADQSTEQPGAAAPPDALAPEPAPPGETDAGPGTTKAEAPRPETRRTRTSTKTDARPTPAVSLVPRPRPPGEESMTIHELCEFTGLAPERVRELERFGLLAGKSVAGATYYEGDAIDVARIAAAFEAHGMEPRHLKMYKSTAERETMLFEQVVTPLLKQRNPRSRRQAAETLTELVNLAHELRHILVKRAVDEMGLG